MIANFKYIVEGIRTVFSSKNYMVLSIITFLFSLLIYLFTLPATYTGGRIGLISLKMLDFRLTFFSFIMAFLISLIIPLIAYSFGNGMRANKTALTGFFGSILPPLLCCSPLIPSLAGILGAISPFFFKIRSIQGFVAANETYILIGSTLLLLFALIQTAKRISVCEC